jgi:hypothetical protein
VGPNPSSSSASSDGLLVAGFALICTPLDLSSADSSPPFQNDGISVLNCVVGVAFVLLGG